MLWPAMFWTALLALAAPSLLAFNVSPSPTLLNQLLAVGGWGALLMTLPGAPRRDGVAAAALPLSVLALLGLAVGVSALQGLPASHAASALAMMACAAAVLLAAQAPTADGRPEGPLLEPVLVGLLVAGVAGSLIGVLQVFAPGWTDGVVLARSGLPGRAVGNLRQPNHLSTLILWGLMALVPLARRGRAGPLRLPGALAAALGALLLLGVALTASRTGALATLLLAGWGLLDRGLPRRLRVALVAVPLVFLALWLGVAAWAHETAHTFGGEARLAENDLSASRFGIWKNTLALIAAQPWTGVGWGEFNFAWSLTPFPGRPIAFFDHSHNLVLQFAVELGVPAALLLTLLLAGAVGLAGWRASRWAGEAGTDARAALLMVLLAGLHSLLEYPLWYAYFLLPTAWALGHALRRPPADWAPTEAPGGARVWALLGLLMLAGALFAGWDYRRVVLIYQPGHSTLSLGERIEDGRRSVFFSHQADYAAATTTEPPSQALGAFDGTVHALLDTRLMMAWARALDEAGHHDRARYLAARLREFRNPASDDFFAACDDGLDEDVTAPLPFQCEAPQQALGWRDFMPR